LLSSQDQKIIDDAVKIADMTQNKSVVVRILGALAIRIHSQNSAELFTRLGRLGNSNRYFTDIDFVAYSKQKGKLRGLFEDELKFKAEIWCLLNTKDRIIYQNSDGTCKVDVFFDKLDYSHQVIFGSDPNKGRLRLDFPTIPLADLLLEKLQIHEINEKDLKDVIILLHEHAIGAGQDKEEIDAKYIAMILANDWGFWYDASANLEKVLAFSSEYMKTGLIPNEVLNDVQNKISQLKQYIDNEPKSKSWTQRDQINVQKQWWKDVEEVSR